MAPRNAYVATVGGDSADVGRGGFRSDVVEFDEQETRTILVTGGAGFIGAASADALLNLGDKVVIIDEMNDYYDVDIKQKRVASLFDKYGDNVTFYKADFCDKDFMAQVFERHDIDIICHLGARAGVRPSIQDPFVYVHSNIEGTVVLLELAVKHNIGNFVYASSSSVYGGSKNEVFRESDVIVEQCSQYAATKASCELIAHTYHHLYGLNVTGLRFFTVYGPNGRPDMAPFKFVHRIYNDIQIDQYGDGSSERDYTFITDIVDGVVRSCYKPLGCKVINLGNGNPIVLKDFIKTVEELLGKKANINIMPMQPGDVPRTCADISEASKLLGYSPSTSLREGLQQTVEWYVKDYAKRNKKEGLVASLNTLAIQDSSKADTTRFEGLAVGLRVHRNNGKGNAAEMAAKVAKRVSEAKAYSSRVSVAVDVADDELVEAVKTAAGDVIDKLIPVEWGRFVPALNALVRDAASAGVDKIMFQSTEIEVKSSSVMKLVEALEEGKTLVAGAALPGHKVGKGRMGLNGLTMPWNTLAVWDVKMLSSTGFLMVSEGIADASSAGVEEAAVIATQQLMHPGAAEAKLIRVPGVAWETNFDDDARAQWHSKKMESKERRVANQLDLIRVPAAVVKHQ